MEVNEKVKKLRQLNHLTQEQMVEKLNLSFDSYQKLERGERQFDINKLERIAAVFGITLPELFAIDENSTICIINEKNQTSNILFISQKTDQISQVYNSNPNDLIAENEKLKLTVEYQNREIELLRQLLATHKNQS